MRKTLRLLAPMFFVGLVAASCGDDDGSGTDVASQDPTSTEAPVDEPTDTADDEMAEDEMADDDSGEGSADDEMAEDDDGADEPTEAPEPTAAASGELPDTPFTTSIGSPYTFAQTTPDPDSLPVAPDLVWARWYRAGATYAVVYEALDAGVDACPGNSVFTGSGWEFISNAPLPNGSCDDFPTRIESSDTQGVQICDGVVGYLTLIPSDTAGTLFASIEKPDESAEGGGVGLTSTVEVTDPNAVPEIDPAILSC